MQSIRPPWFDPAMPSREQSVVRHILDRAATEHSDRLFARFEDGSAWTYGAARRLARATAEALHRMGVRRGDMVSVWLPNGAACLRVWLGINYLGAVFAPINTSYRGRLLEHVLRNTGARVLVIHADLVERLDGIDTGRTERLVVHGAAQKTALPAQGFEALDGDPGGLPADAPIEPWDLCAVIYTSGTTGPSKGVLQTYLQIWTTGICSYGYINADDRMVINLPMFHVGGTSSIYGVLARGASLALFQGFNTPRFWDEIRETGATTTSGLIGSMAEFLMKAPPKPDDADNPLRCLTMAPINAATMAFAKRFGFDYLTGFNMTEVSVPLVTEINSTVPLGCGKPRTGIEARIVDANDMEVPDGTVGELVIRSDLPWAITPGYLNMPEATAKVWRNGWFHTGDGFRKDADGQFFFVDRLKDTIRRRGENVSSIEVELEVGAHPAVQEAAAVGVPSPHGEEDILVCLAFRPGQQVEPAALVEFLRPRMAHFMVPRYLRVLPALPKTPTNKVQKAELRRDGVTADTWDREAAGIVIKKEKFAT